MAKTKPVQAELSIRKINILKSPKRGMTSDRDSVSYLRELNVQLVENKQPMQFSSNINEHIHRWSPYVQGFSAYFVQSIVDRYKDEYESPVFLDPFAGCGTVLVQAKLNGYKSFGTELNPLLQFISDTKLNCWDVSPSKLLKRYNSVSRSKKSPAPSFLKSDRQFSKGVLDNLEILKGGIEAIQPKDEKDEKIKNLIRVAFSSILIECSKLKRSPCLGYDKNKKVEDVAPFVLLNQKIHDIADDLKLIKTQYRNFVNVDSKVILANAIEFTHKNRYDLVITSPPYMNGLDYIINYKIEMGWLGFVNSHKDLKKIKDSMVVCDNVSKGLISNFVESKPYTNEWIEQIRENIQKNIVKRGAYRRKDMPHIVHKYFDDMYKVMGKVVESMNSGARFILVVGDSLIADVYVPTDLLIAKIGQDLNLEIEKIEKGRERRSGQIRSYKLRESIVTLRKR